jgi:hypothetical protein
MSLGRLRRWVAGLALAAASLSLENPATAVENGKIRLGSDYDIFQTGSDDFRSCERACSEDARCKSWTFITNLGQCRLKHSVAPKFDNSCCVSDVKQEKPKDRRADEVLCADYAVSAVQANNINLSSRCGYRGPLWSASFSDVFNRCLDISPERRGREADQRSEAIEDCRKLASRSTKAECDTIARLAVQQAKSQADNRCGFNPGNWHADQTRYVKTCTSSDRSLRWDFLFRRETQLGACLARGGGTDRDCDDYANRSVTQFRRAQQLRCGGAFSGLFWHANADDHYEWCRQSAKGERDRWISRRQQQLNECEAERRKGFKFILKF